jgi:hypothetical protein
MRWEEYVAHMEEINSYNITVGKPEEKKPIARPRRRWEENGSLGK